MIKFFITTLMLSGSLACSANPVQDEIAKCKSAKTAIDESMKSNKYDAHAVKNAFKSSQMSPGCDDGFYGEGFSDIVVKSLASDFSNVIMAASEDKSLRDFVVKHIDSTTDWDDLDKVGSNAKRMCPETEMALCKTIGAKAVEASKEARKAIQK